MANEIWVISDTHFGHTNILEYANRPFQNVDDMNEYMVERWNSVVKEGDKVYHLGDVYFKDASMLSQLNGKKRLILGNHDDGRDKKLLAVFQKILSYRMMPQFGLIFSHIPIHEKSLLRSGQECVNVHGHIHEKPQISPRHRNVCVEELDYTPINIEDLRIK